MFIWKPKFLKATLLAPLSSLQGMKLGFRAWEWRCNKKEQNVECAEIMQMNKIIIEDAEKKKVKKKKGKEKTKDQ